MAFKSTMLFLKIHDKSPRVPILLLQKGEITLRFQSCCKDKMRGHEWSSWNLADERWVSCWLFFSAALCICFMQGCRQSQLLGKHVHLFSTPFPCRACDWPWWDIYHLEINSQQSTWYQSCLPGFCFLFDCLFLTNELLITLISITTMLSW